VDRAGNETTQFHIRVDGGHEQVFESHTSIYPHAVMAAFGALKLPFPCEVEIWVPHLVPHGYGPYRYLIDDFDDGRGNRYGCPAVLNQFRTKADPTPV
jgi:hypothetical protein